MHSIHLKPLRRHFEEMEECEFQELEQKIIVIFHLLCLIWAHSTHYQKPARMVVILQEISNLLIHLVGTSHALLYLAEPDECKSNASM